MDTQHRKTRANQDPRENAYDFTNNGQSSDQNVATKLTGFFQGFGA